MRHNLPVSTRTLVKLKADLSFLSEYSHNNMCLSSSSVCLVQLNELCLMAQWVFDSLNCDLVDLKILLIFDEILAGH